MQDESIGSVLGEGALTCCWVVEELKLLCLIHRRRCWWGWAKLKCVALKSLTLHCSRRLYGKFKSHTKINDMGAKIQKGVRWNNGFHPHSEELLEFLFRKECLHQDLQKQQVWKERINRCLCALLKEWEFLPDEPTRELSFFH